MSDLYCVLGNPVSHSRSPWIHQHFAATCAQGVTYTARHIDPSEFARGIAQLRSEGFLGCNVTVPFKFEALQLAQQVSPRARLAGAANVLSFHGQVTSADNTDGIGLVTDITVNAATSIRGKRVLLLGAGGAAAGALGPLIEQQPDLICVHNRTAQKVAALCGPHLPLALLHKVELKNTVDTGHNANFSGFMTFSGTSDDKKSVSPEGGFDIVINATSSSLNGALPEVAPSVFKPGCLAYDMMYGPAAEPFLTWAQSHGARPRDGLGMLVEQAAAAFALWRGVTPNAAATLVALRAALDAAPAAPKTHSRPT